MFLSKKEAPAAAAIAEKPSGGALGNWKRTYIPAQNFDIFSAGSKTPSWEEYLVCIPASGNSQILLAKGAMNIGNVYKSHGTAEWNCKLDVCD